MATATATLPPPSTHSAVQYTGQTTNLTSRLSIHDHSSSPSSSWFPWVLTRMLPGHLPPTTRILEVGSGTGALWSTYLSSNTTGAPPTHTPQPNVTVTDLSPSMTSSLAATFSAVPSMKVVQCPATSLPFEEGSFDIVIANHMLYHVDEPSQAISEFHRVLVPGGKVFIALNGLSHLDEILDIGAKVGRPSLMRAHARVTAETGRQLLETTTGRDGGGALFTEVTEERCPGWFEVGTTGPAVAYVESLGAGTMGEEMTAHATRLVGEIIEKEGVFKVTKNMVLFSAVRA